MCVHIHQCTCPRFTSCKWAQMRDDAPAAEPRPIHMHSTTPPDAAAIAYVYPRRDEVSAWCKLATGGLAPLLCVRPSRLSSGIDSSDFFEGVREAFARVRACLRACARVASLAPFQSRAASRRGLAAR